TYVVAEAGAVSDEDEARITGAVAAARVRRPDLDGDLFGFLEDLLLVRVLGNLEGELAMRVQQVTGPVMAKGVEDTTFYTFNRLVALNEVGGDPGRFDLSVAAFHSETAAIGERWPLTMTALSTHDTKRSEDVRARIAVLSEMPALWAETVNGWAQLTMRHKWGGMPDTNAEWLLYQTLVGAWPISATRMVAYAEKAAKEAKTHTSW